MNYLNRFAHLISLENPILLEKSLLNCHSPGVHSFVLSEKDGCLTRMFIATDDHILWHNHCGIMQKEWHPLSIAIHPHHVDIEIYPVFGLIWNVEFKFKRNKGQSYNDCLLDAYSWKSEILNGKGGFRWCGEKKLKLDDHKLMLPGRKYKMVANELHTVYVSKGQCAAWIIQEYPASKNYDGICYSNHDLSSWTSDGLYTKPKTLDDIVEIFKQIDILL